MNLLPGESVLISTNNNILILTNYRVCYDSSKTGSSKYVSITLDSVSSCGLVTRTNPILLVIAVLIAVFGFYLMADDSMPEEFVPYFLILVGLLVLLYFIIRAAVIKIGSNGGDPIMASVAGMGKQTILEFLNAVDSAKIRYLNSLRTGS